ncbi:hypothetical protein [Secundilactobacillus kimchicus]|uniref:hypothetical protein n=1 Tax=Secundilactobacillus kimchicus TaxID=528209 RepID=UPI0024A82EDB|nr:hypothetical protein [Secundilactobacillus kimchicus]
MAFKFRTFNHYQFGRDRLKQPIHVTVPASNVATNQADKYDSYGNPIQSEPEELDLCEPILKATTNTVTSPGTDYQSQGGGMVEVTHTQWVSARGDFPHGTKVLVKASGNQYVVDTHTVDEVAGITTYYLKAVSQ